MKRVFMILLILVIWTALSSFTSALHENTSLHLLSAERKSPSHFAINFIENSNDQQQDSLLSRSAQVLGAFEDGINRTAGTNCKQSPSSSYTCDMCCNEKCCEDPQYWSSATKSLENAQSWIPVRVVYILPQTVHPNTRPADWQVHQLLAKTNEAFVNFPFRFLFNSSEYISNTTLNGFCPTDGCYTDPNCGFFKEIIPAVQQRHDHEIVLIVCHGINYLGEAQFPWGAPQYQYVQLQLSNFLGAAIVHELGHYLGLMHTFQGACDSQGDWVSDTVAAASASPTCGSVRDSCVSVAGYDDTRNFMNYGMEWNCGMGFTSGQVARAIRAMEYYRPSLIANTRVALNESNSGNASIAWTRTPGCAIQAKTFSDCWCENDQLDPSTWCTTLAPPGSTFTTAVTIAPTTTSPPPNSGAEKVSLSLMMMTVFNVILFFCV